MTSTVAMDARSLTVLLIDSDPLVRRGLTHTLQEELQLEVLASCANLATGLAWLRTRRAGDVVLPQVVLVNLASWLGQGREDVSVALKVTPGVDLVVSSQELATLATLRSEFLGLPVLALGPWGPLTLRPEAELNLARWAKRQRFMGYVGLSAGPLPAPQSWIDPHSLDPLNSALRQIVRGQPVWPTALAPRRPQAPNAAAPSSRLRFPDLGLPSQSSGRSFGAWQSQSPLAFPLGSALGAWDTLISQGLEEIETTLATLEAQRASAQTPWWDDLWLAGWQRELRSAQWLLRQSFADRTRSTLPQQAKPASPPAATLATQPAANPAANLVTDPGPNPGSNPADRPSPDPQVQPAQARATSLPVPPRSPWLDSLDTWELTGEFPVQPSPRPEAPSYPTPALQYPSQPAVSIAPQRQTALSTRSDFALSADMKRQLAERQLDLIEQTALQIAQGVLNRSGAVMELDILTPLKREELLGVVLRQVEYWLGDLRAAVLSPEQIHSQRLDWVDQLWQASVEGFLGKYATLSVQGQTVSLVQSLLGDRPLVRRAILNKIPLVGELLQSLLLGQPVWIDGVAYRLDSPEAVQRLSLILQNLIIQVANGVLQPLLNQFADVESLKQTFYDRRLISSREIDRFRNNLSWKYRISNSIQEAQAIYESRYELLRFNAGTLESLSLYAPRREELADLSSWQQTVTLALEVRDAIAPRLQLLAAWVGNGLVYVLTHILGRGLGLVGRGILQGIGTSLQDSGLTRRSPRRED